VQNCPGPTVIVAHSLGCIAFAHWAIFARERVRVKVKGAFRKNALREIREFASAPNYRLPELPGWFVGG
jgi:predicted alpha/beta hydrolase family esterase